jgi:hypothetical protein
MQMVNPGLVQGAQRNSSNASIVTSDQLRPAFRDDTALFFRNGNELPVGNPHFQAVADFSSSSGDRYGSITTPQSVGIWAIGHNQTQGEDSALSGAKYVLICLAHGNH